MEKALLERRKIGILSGSGPNAGLDLWGKILEENRLSLGDEYRGDIDAPYLVILSSPELGLSMQLDDNFYKLMPHFKEVVQQLARLVDYFSIACHTLHCFSDEVSSMGLASQFVSIADICVNEVAQRGFTRVGVLGTSHTLNFDKYPFLSDLRRQSEVEMPPNSGEVDHLIY